MRIWFDVSVVVYRETDEVLTRLLDSLAAQSVHCGAHFQVWLRNNDPDDAGRLDQFVHASSNYPFDLSVSHSRDNVGFGVAHNATFEATSAPFFFILNPDGWLHSTAIDRLVAAIGNSSSNVGAWELRQLPFEHPKVYDPSTLQVSWISGAGAVFRREAFAQVRGFEPCIFMYGEDVDLSWRLRASGWTLRYVPDAVVVHHTYASPGEVKPAQIVNGVLASLQLRTRFGTWADILRGLGCWLLQLARRPRFEGARRRHIATLPQYLRSMSYFRRTGLTYRQTGFRPEFRFWSYSDKREGAFFEFSTTELDPDVVPLVSIIVRTHRRPALLREALMSLLHQTYPRLEVVVVEDGPENSRSLVEKEFEGRLNVRYISTGVPVGRSAAGNRGLAIATGEWFGFLDDDDQFYADHIEALMQVVGGTSSRVMYSAAHEIPTKILALTEDSVSYQEADALLKYRPYSRLAMWQENLAPIQAVLFHRSLYDEFGGFDEDLDQLEDWVLWVRYSCATNFESVNRVTSRFRVPMSGRVALERQANLHSAYSTALERQRKMRVTLSPLDVTSMAEEQARRQAIIHVSRRRARMLFTRMRFMRRIFSTQAGWRRRISALRRRISP
ncbi:hypothetical protein R70211_02214 [Paraburkholderia domus]|uniref:Glycosyltransferase 2-like domain-containing protein n=1 Tax=Paraburkholderia domus TaxID=2793075 RepID=A0A9N8QYR0_9BURK|nr:hypothetical protein R70211_02214 [Paraburkholderia domus]